MVSNHGIPPASIISGALIVLSGLIYLFSVGKADFTYVKEMHHYFSDLGKWWIKSSKRFLAACSEELQSLSM